MIYSIPQPIVEYIGWCHPDCPFLDWKKEGCEWAYCHFLKKSLQYYDFSLSECDIDYDCKWAIDNPVNNEHRE